VQAAPVSGLVRSLEAVRAVFANPALRNLQLAWLGSSSGHFAYAVALSVYAYRQGGASAVGVVWLLRTLPAAVVAPFTAVLSDRYRRERVMLLGNLVRAAATGATAGAVLWGAPAELVYAPSILVAIVGTSFWPAQTAILPTLARTPAELTGANTVSTTLDNVGTFLGPALCGLLLALTNIEAAFLATGAAFLASALLLGRVHTARGPGWDGEEVAGDVVAQLLAGFRATLRNRDIALLTGVHSAWAIAEGALNVLLVVAAIDLLDLGEGGVGLLNAAIGVGGLAGALVALALAGRARLARLLALALACWGLPIAIVGVWPKPVAALLLLGIVGVARIIIEVAGVTLLQRIVPDELRSRVFGILEALWVAGIGLGAVAAPALIAVAGEDGALVVFGLAPLGLMLVVWPWLRTVDAAAAPPPRELELVRGVPFLALLPAPAVEQLAKKLVPVRAAAGEMIIREGESGDRFYVVGAGQAEVTVQGERVATRGPGDFFGEIALLRRAPRMATVIARTDLELFALEQADFLAAVTGHTPSAAEADRVASARLAATALPRVP
jgi:MFS family permease